MWCKFHGSNAPSGFDENRALRPARIGLRRHMAISLRFRFDGSLLPDLHSAIEGRRCDDGAEFRVRPSDFGDGSIVSLRIQRRRTLHTERKRGSRVTDFPIVLEAPLTSRFIQYPYFYSLASYSQCKLAKTAA